MGAVLLVFTAVFDLIHHEMLLMKLAAYGFSALIWTRSYLFSRTQTVFFNGSFSVHQGPLLYSVLC